MTKRKSILVSILIMIPFGGIIFYLCQTAVRAAIPFVVILALYGFAKLWQDVIEWLITPDSGYTFRRSKKHEKKSNEFDEFKY